MLKNTFKNFVNGSVLMVALSLMGQVSFAGPQEVKGCLAQALAKENPVFQVSDVPSPYEKYSRYLVLICGGKSAEALFRSLSSKPIEGEWSGKTRGEFKYLGEDGGASMCYHINTDSDGRIVDEYNCSIRLSVGAENLGKTTESEMKPFVLKDAEVKPSVETAGFKKAELQP